MLSLIAEKTGYPPEMLDGEGNVYLSLSGYRTVELPGGPEAERIAPLRAAMESLS